MAQGMDRKKKIMLRTGVKFNELLIMDCIFVFFIYLFELPPLRTVMVQ